MVDYAAGTVIPIRYEIPPEAFGVVFCSICNVSIPDMDLPRAAEVDGKTCCKRCASMPVQPESEKVARESEQPEADWHCLY